MTVDHQVAAGPVAHARRAGFLRDLATVAGRALRSIPREPEAVIPAIAVPVFFFIVNVGSLQNIAQRAANVIDFKAFQLPVAIIFAVTGVSRASALLRSVESVMGIGQNNPLATTIEGGNISTRDAPIPGRCCVVYSPAKLS